MVILHQYTYAKQPELNVLDSSGGWLAEPRAGLRHYIPIVPTAKYMLDLEHIRSQFAC